MVNRGSLFIISGPSGVGKGTVCAALLAQCPDIVCSVSATTRAPRKGEVEGKSYFFLSREEFIARRDAGEFLEWAELYGNYYGTPAAAVQELLAAGKNVILEIDTQGAMQVKTACPEGVLVFILPPSFDELENRIVHRGTETQQMREQRLACARREMDLAEQYDHVIVNLDVDGTVARLLDIIKAENEKHGA